MSELLDLLVLGLNGLVVFLLLRPRRPVKVVVEDRPVVPFKVVLPDRPAAQVVVEARAEAPVAVVWGQASTQADPRCVDLPVRPEAHRHMFGTLTSASPHWCCSVCGLEGPLAHG